LGVNLKINNCVIMSVFLLIVCFKNQLILERETKIEILPRCDLC
jgi:hypothetical protein